MPMLQTSIPPTPPLRTLLLFPRHLSPSPTTLPLLQSLKSLLDASYTGTYCSRPDIFGTSFVRLASEGDLKDVVGERGFTVAVFAAGGRGDGGEGDGWEGGSESGLGGLVATGSVRVVDDESMRLFNQWVGKPLRGRDSAEARSLSTHFEELTEKMRALERERQSKARVYELCAFGVAPGYQGCGVGVRVLEVLEWLVGGAVGGWGEGMDEDVVGFEVEGVGGVGRGDAEGGEGVSARGKIVLVAIREIGNEGYYRRRGYESIGTGVLPVGTWGSKVECTTVFMEKRV